MEEILQCSLWKTPALLLRTLIIYTMILSLTLLGENNGLSDITLGYTVPEGDIDLMVGTPLEIFCTLNEKLGHYSAEDIIFYRNDNLIDQRYVNVINETTSRLYMESLNESRNWFCCKLKYNDELNQNDNRNSKMPEQVIDFNFVRIGTLPKGVENFSCVSKNWEILNCSWTVPDDVLPTNYDISFKIRKKYYNCPNNIGLSYCVWTRSSWPLYQNNFHEVRYKMIGKNSFNYTSTQYFNILNYAIIIPNPPSLESVSNATTSSIYLKLNFGGTFAYYPYLIDYKVQYKWEDDLNLDSTVIVYGNSTIKNKSVYLNVTDLPYPNMRYYFSVSIKTAKASNNTGWSAPAFGEFETLSAMQIPENGYR